MPVLDLATTKVKPWFLIYGAPGSGKTTLASTAEQDQKKILFVNFDKDGYATLIARGLEPLVFDISQVHDYKVLVKELADAQAFIRDAVKSKGVTTVVVDTLSTLDIKLQYHMQRLHSGQQIWGQLARHHLDFIMPLVEVPANFLFLAHVKYNHAVIEADDVKFQAKAKAVNAPGQVDYTFEMAGQSKKFYTGQCSYVFPIYRKVSKEGGETRVIVSPLYGYEAKNREANMTGERPANMQEIFKELKHMQTKG